jgi:hypothetical protein
MVRKEEDANMRDHDTLLRTKKALRRYGWDLVTWSPGDGPTRYRLVPAGESYFSIEGPTALGREAAAAMARGALHVLMRNRLDEAAATAAAANPLDPHE